MAIYTKNRELLDLLAAAESDEVARLALADCLEELKADDMAAKLRSHPQAQVVRHIRQQCLARKLICWRDLPEYDAAGKLLDRLEGADWNALPEHEGRMSSARLHELTDALLASVVILGAVSAGQGLGGRILLTIRPSFPTTALKLDAKELLERLIACVFPDHAEKFEVH